MDQFEQFIPFKVIKKQSDYYTPNQCQHYKRNENWRTSSFLKQTILLELEEMANVRYLQLNNFQYGTEMSIYISECQSGPYVAIKENKFYSRKNVKRICLSSLPCKYIKIVCTKGVHVNLKDISLIGARSEDIADEEDEFKLFKLLVTNPQRIMYV